MANRLTFTSYSLRRLAQRNITREEAQAVVDAPSTTFPSPHKPNRRRYRGTVGGRRISVVVEVATMTCVTVWDEDEDDAK